MGIENNLTLPFAPFGVSRPILSAETSVNQTLPSRRVRESPRMTRAGPDRELREGARLGLLRMRVGHRRALRAEHRDCHAQDRQPEHVHDRPTRRWPRAPPPALPGGLHPASSSIDILPFNSSERAKLRGPTITEAHRASAHAFSPDRGAVLFRTKSARRDGTVIAGQIGSDRSDRRRGNGELGGSGHPDRRPGRGAGGQDKGCARRRPPGRAQRAAPAAGGRERLRGRGRSRRPAGGQTVRPRPPPDGARAEST